MENLIICIVLIALIILYPNFKKGFQELVLDIFEMFCFIIIKPINALIKWLRK